MKAYILIGVPGSGKTTWAKSQTWAVDHAYVSTDEFVEEYAKSVGKTYSEVFEEYMPRAVELMVDKVVEARDNKKNIIWDQTSLTIASRKKKFNMLPDYYHIAVTFRTPHRLELNKRLENRPGKVIPQSVLTMMTNSIEEATEEEGYKELWYVG